MHEISDRVCKEDSQDCVMDSLWLTHPGNLTAHSCPKNEQDKVQVADIERRESHDSRAATFHFHSD